MLDKYYKWSAPKSLRDTDILEVLDKSAIFSFTVRQERQEPFRHTAIELQFDRQAFFTINRRIPDKTTFTTACIGADAVTYIEYSKEIASKDCGIIFQSTNKIESEEIIRKLLEDSEKRYNLYDKNCRDHVTKTVLNAMEGKKWNYVSKQEFLDFVEQVRQEDRRRVAIIALIYLFLISQLASNLFICNVTIFIPYCLFYRDTAILILQSVHSYLVDFAFYKQLSYYKFDWICSLWNFVLFLPNVCFYKFHIAIPLCCKNFTTTNFHYNLYFKRIIYWVCTDFNWLKTNHAKNEDFFSI